MIPELTEQRVPSSNSFEDGRVVTEVDESQMANIKDIDVASLSTNQPFTMPPEQCVKAAKTIKPKALFPYHYSDTDISKVMELLKESGIDVRIRNYQ